ncbi:hypothetical protein GYMLUDRAFT_39177 [Collybiopsis luxurians FD-317 M1]|nr:hypothetical protein GYMLUDRAFT_39177 [Collybiopsis luxurians FD-317 M1]
MSHSQLFFQVGGHPNTIQTTEDGSMLIKPALPLENEFYTVMEQARTGVISIEEDSNPKIDDNTLRSMQNLHRLSRYVPRFYGTLRLQENAEMDETRTESSAQNLTPETIAQPTHKNAKDASTQPQLVLSNLQHDFAKPNIIDVKLGTILYDELDPNCSEEKKIKMTKRAQQTTSGETGMRLVGFQVHPQPTPSSDDPSQPVVTTKVYGQSLKKEQLAEGIRRVFPLLGDSVPVPIDNHKSTRQDLGLPAPLLLPILRRIHSSVNRLRGILAKAELRLIATSLLVVWEGDEHVAQDGVKWMEERMKDQKDGEDSESEDEDEEEEEEDDPNEGEDVPEASVQPDSTSPRSTSTNTNSKRKPHSPCTISLIDFAHTRFVPGQGPDRGVLLGLETFMKLIEGRIGEVEGKFESGC